MLNKPINEITFKDLNEYFYTNGFVESQTIELKKALSLNKEGKPNTAEFAKDITSFANTTGGFIVLGVNEKKQEICGTSTKIGAYKIEDWIANVLNDFVDQAIPYNIASIPISDAGEESVVIIQIPEGKAKPYYVNNEGKHIPYLRKGTSIFAAKPSDIKQMYDSSKKNVGEETVVNIIQEAKGKTVQQIGQNHGSIINTEKIVQKTEVAYNPELYITDSEALQIKNKVDEIIEINEKAGKFTDSKSKSNFYASTWQSLKKKFGVTKYTLLPKEKFNDCMTWLQSQIAYKHTPKLRRTDKEQWRNSRYKSIYARAKELNISKEELLEFAFEKLELKSKIESLKDLNDTNLNKLYRKLFSL